MARSEARSAQPAVDFDRTLELPPETLDDLDELETTMAGPTQPRQARKQIVAHPLSLDDDDDDEQQEQELRIARELASRRLSIARREQRHRHSLELAEQRHRHEQRLLRGRQEARIVGGVLLGGLLGGAIGNHLDQKDKEMAARNAQATFETTRTGQTTAWRNPDSGNSGTLTPTRTYQTSSGQYCREYQQEITVGGEKQQSYGTACRQPDGSWKIQS